MQQRTTVWITFTIMRLTDAFIESVLHCIFFFLSFFMHFLVTEPKSLVSVATKPFNHQNEQYQDGHTHKKNFKMSDKMLFNMTE